MTHANGDNPTARDRLTRSVRTRPTPWVGLLTGVDREPVGLFPPGWDLSPAKLYTNPPRRRVTPRRGFRSANQRPN